MLGARDNNVYYGVSKDAENENLQQSSIYTFEKCYREFSQFIRFFKKGNQFVYRKQLITNVQLGNFYLDVHLTDLSVDNGELYDALYERPLQLIAACEYGLKDAYYRSVFSKSIEEVDESSLPTPDNLSDPLVPTNTLQPIPSIQIHLHGGKETTIRALGAATLDKLVSISGVIVQLQRSYHKASKVKIMCRSCRDVQHLQIPLYNDSIRLPPRCLSSHRPASSTLTLSEPCVPEPYLICHNDTVYTDVQVLKIQELSHQILTGDIPRTITVLVNNQHNNINLNNILVAGSKITITGVLLPQSSSSKSSSSSGATSANNTRTVYLHSLGIVYNNKIRLMTYTPDEIQIFRSISNNPLLLAKLLRSVAPSIYGYDDVKLALLLSVLSSPRKKLKDNIFIKGDINILLIGEPGIGKSQLLKYATELSLISVYTSGKSSSSAGLTCSVMKKNNHFVLESGAMILADDGVICIDEFDKMRVEDRVIIHEAMEQQTISISKAGINTVLNCRCAVIASANPSFGSFKGREVTGEGESYGDLHEQIDFESTILSRFDLIFLLRDVKNMEKDLRIAQHVLKLHSDGVTNQGEEVAAEEGRGEEREEGEEREGEFFSTDFMRKYVNYARTNIYPVLSNDANDLLINNYVEWRKEISVKRLRNEKHIPITVRQLDAIQRVASAFARLELSNVITIQHVEKAIDLFKKSTLASAREGYIDSMVTNYQEQESMEDCQKLILAFLSIGAVKKKEVIYLHVCNQGYNRFQAQDALKMLIRESVLIDKGSSVLRRA